jgi:hypothetical protein
VPRGSSAVAVESAIAVTLNDNRNILHIDHLRKMESPRLLFDFSAATVWGAVSYLQWPNPSRCVFGAVLSGAHDALCAPGDVW